MPLYSCCHLLKKCEYSDASVFMLSFLSFLRENLFEVCFASRQFQYVHTTDFFVDFGACFYYFQQFFNDIWAQLFKAQRAC